MQQAAWLNSKEFSLRVSNELSLKIAISEMCHAEGLLFNIGIKDQFRKFLNLARRVGDLFIPPNIHFVGGELLYLNFKRKEAENLAKINEQADVFGLTLLGDSATVKMITFINEIALSENMSSVVLEINDCLEHMVAGGNKDAPYISAIFPHHLTVIDKNRNLSDLIFFDGASNVQKAGKKFNPSFLKLLVFMGQKCFALLFTDLYNMDDIKVSLLPAIRL